MTLRGRVSDLRDELRVLGVALSDPRTPPHAKAIAGLTVGLAASPVDPIPDVIPVLGYLDDAVFVPLGVYLARRAVPEDVMVDAREVAGDAAPLSSRRRLGLLVVLAGWVVAGLALGWAVAGLALG